MKTATVIFLFAAALIVTAAVVTGCARTESAFVTALPNPNEPIQVNAASANKADADNKAISNKDSEDNASAIQKTTADALVKELYRQHDKNQSPFDQTRNRRLVDKYFAKPLADLIWQDAKRVVEDESDVDPDPLYDGGQDSEVKKFVVGQPSIKGDEATVVASYVDYGKKRTITFRLVQENQNWKIADINYTDGSSLLESYRSKAGN